MGELDNKNNRYQPPAKAEGSTPAPTGKLRKPREGTLDQSFNFDYTNESVHEEPHIQDAEFTEHVEPKKETAEGGDANYQRDNSYRMNFNQNTGQVSPEEDKPITEITELVYNPEDVPVWVLKQMFLDTGEVWDFRKPIYDDANRNVNVMLMQKYLDIDSGNYYTEDGRTLFATKQYFVYMPLDGMYDSQHYMLYSDKNEKDKLYDKLGRPVYPLATESGYIFSNNRLIYPALGPSGSYFVKDPTVAGETPIEVKPVFMQLYSHDGRPIYPYSEADPHAMEEVEENPQPAGFYDPYAQKQLEAPEEETLEEPEETGFSAWIKEPKNKWIFGGGIVAFIILVALGIWGIMSAFAGSDVVFELVEDTVHAEYGEEFILDPADFLGKNYPEDVDIVVDPELNMNKSTKKLTSRGGDKIAIGQYTIEFKYEKESVEGMLIVEDTQDPDIEGPSSVSFGIGEYSESALLTKYTIDDASKVTTTVETYGKNLSSEGSYKIDLTATDAIGNRTTKNITVTIAKTADQIAEEEAAAKEAEEKAAKEAEEKAAKEAEEQAAREAELAAKEEEMNQKLEEAQRLLEEAQKQNAQSQQQTTNKVDEVKQNTSDVIDNASEAINTITDAGSNFWNTITGGN